MDPRVFTAISAVVVFGLATLCVFAYHIIERPGHSHCELSRRLLTYSLWVLALLGVYSATSFMWAADIEDWVLELTRLVRLALTTATGIMLVGVLAFYIRVLRRGDA